MKKLIFYLLFPFWYFMAKTWVGGVFLLVFCITITGVTLLSALTLIGVDADVLTGAGSGIAIVSLLCTPFVLLVCEKIDFWMEDTREAITGIKMTSRNDF